MRILKVKLVINPPYQKGYKSRKEQKIMATNNFNFDMNKYRAILATWNLIGQTLCCIEADNMDLSHNDKVREGLLRLTKPLRKYSIKMIDITSAKLDPLPDENGMVITLNGDTTLQFPLAPCEFKEVSMETVTAAIKKMEDTKETTFFRDLNRLTDVVTKLNKIEKKKADDLLEEIVGWSSAYDDINKILVTNNDEYYRSLGLKE